MKYKNYKMKEIASFSQGKQVEVNEQYAEKSENKERFIRIVDYTNENEPIRYVKNFGERYYAKKNDLVMIRYGSQTAGKVVMGKEGIIANNMFKINLNNEIILNKYMYYYLSQKEVYKYIRNSQSSSTMPALNFGILNDFEIKIPNIEEQKRTVKILSLIDKKIDENNHTNNNLQEISKQLYKRWFIDFEFSNEDGNPYKSSGGKMIDSELGKIPEGWNIYKLDELFYHISPGTNYQPKRVETGIPFLNVKNINNGYIDTTDSKYITEEDYKKVHKSWKPEENDLLLSRIGTIGLVTTIRQEDLPLAVHYNFIVLKTNSLPFEFAYFLLQSDDFQSKYRYCVKQSVQEYVTVEDAKNIKVALPKNNVLYDIFIKNYERILNIQRENKNLEQLRDTLLPKLMNGEIDLDNIEI